MVDRYTKVVLTVIAAGLIALVAEQAIPRAAAYGLECGDRYTNPCYVEITGLPPR